MSGAGLSRLCRFIEFSLRHHNELVEIAELTREEERKLLISLAQIVRQIQGLIGELESSASSDEQSNDEGERCTSVCEDHHCVTNIVGHLIKFLCVESRYVQHSAGNIIVAISMFLSQSGTSWEVFIDLLCICLEMAMFKAFSCGSVGRVEQGPTVIQKGLKNSNLNTVAGILRILRAIVKSMKEEHGIDDGSLEVLLNSLSLCFTRLPWDTLDELHTHGSIVDQVGSIVSSLTSSTQTESKIIFLGSLVQLFCSTVETVDITEGAAATSQSTVSLIHRIKSLVPRISEWCFSVHCDKNIKPYFQHKVLILMSRLGSHVRKDCSTNMLWLQLLHKHYEGFLTKSLSLTNSDEDNCLEGSPFLLSLCDQETNHISFSHLQRQSIFLFLKSSMCFIVGEDSNGMHCTCNSSDPEGTGGCNARKTCIVKFYEWIKLHILFDAAEESFTKKCFDFSSSFVKLYMHEDDMLFEVLLQMLGVATFADKYMISKDALAPQEPAKDALSNISTIFNPVLLFHIFLAELQYNHQLLLDYLISKDSGTRCAEYLLKCLNSILQLRNTCFIALPSRVLCTTTTVFSRWLKLSLLAVIMWAGLYSGGLTGAFSQTCLRIVCDSWQAFVELPLGLNDDGRRTPKKAKIPLHNRSGAISLCLLKAKTCLLSLQSALQKLDRRGLFPYNPNVLLRRLERFEELCNHQS